MRVTGKHRAEEAERDQEWEQMSPEERKFMSESVEDRAARLESFEHLDEYGRDRAGD